MHPEVERIRNRRARNPWPKYLYSVRIDELRGWKGQEVRFEFPVTAVCGENGSGKSTVLKVAAAAYTNSISDGRSYYPSTFFPDTPWEEVSGTTLTYRLCEGSNQREFYMHKPTTRWRFQRNRPLRHVIFQDVSRTLPLDATVGYAYIAKRTAQEVSAESLSPTLTTYFGSIMGRSYTSARFALSDVDSQRAVGVVSTGNLEFSQFHQGAGEDATLDLISLLQNVPDTALVILDEAEASLHPRSQRRLIHFLLWLSRTKQIQVILSTHSPYVLEELPPEARVFLARQNYGIEVVYGVTPNFALDRMDDVEKPDLYLMTEDDETTVLAASLLRASSIDLSRLSFVEVGPCNVVTAVGIAAESPRFPVRALGVLDADQPVQKGSIKLPGSQCPERQVFCDVRAMAVKQLSTRLGLSEDAVVTALDRAMSVLDVHDWPSHFARITSQTISYTWETLAQVWVQSCIHTEDLSAFANAVKAKLP